MREHYSLDHLLHLTEIAPHEPCFDKLRSPEAGFIKDWTLIKKDAGEPERPFVITAAYQSRLADEFYTGYCSGKGLTLEQAENSAAGEAVERYNAAPYAKTELLYTAYQEIKTQALDPRELVLYLPKQYPKIPFKPFKEDNVLGWVNAFSLVQNRYLLVPAISVFLHYKLQNADEKFAEMQSTGLATANTLPRAIIAGAIEVIERDAFMNTWYNRLECEQIDILSHPSAELAQMYEHYRKAGVHLHLLKLRTDAPCHVFMAIAKASAGQVPCFSVGLGSGFSSTGAAMAALLELAQVRASSNNYYQQAVTRKRIDELVKCPGLVSTINDHRLLYATADHARAFDFLLEAAFIVFEWDEQPLVNDGDALQQLISYVKRVGSDLIYYNLSMPETESNGLFSCRAILPGFQPIHFGYNNMRLAARRLFALPVQLGQRRNASSPESLHVYPHPLA